MGKTKKKPSSNFSTGDKITTWVFLVPTFTILLITAFIPLLNSLFLSFHEYRLNVPNPQPLFIGLGNYIELFADSRFIISSRNTAVFALVSVFFQIVLGTIMAMMLASDSKVTRFIVSLFLVPMIMAPVASGTLWRMMMDRTTGVVNYFISMVGIEPIAFLADTRYAMASIIFVDVWRLTPWVTILIASALKGLSGTVIEAAVVDGASRLLIFRKIILPLISPVMIIVLMIRLIDAFKVFDTVHVMTGGGPGMSTEMLPNFIFNQGLRFLNIGYASALAWIFILVMSLVSILFIHLRNKANEIK